jgi:hypothetical protein
MSAVYSEQMRRLSMSVNKCPWCGGKFGLVRRYAFGKSFCCDRYRRKYQASWERLSARNAW